MQDYEKAEYCLRYINPNCERNEWWRVLASVKGALPEAEAKVLVLNWSMQGSSFNKADFESTWRSTNANGGLGLGSLVYMAGINKDNAPDGFFSSDEYTEKQAKLEANRIAIQNKIEDAERKLAEEKERKRQEKLQVGNECAKKFASCQDCYDHPYLRAKNVKSYGLKIYNNELLIPVYSSENLSQMMSMQRIFPGKDKPFEKRFVAGASTKAGCFVLDGDISKASVIAFAEGYATGATIHELMPEWTVVITFSCGNLDDVALNIHSQVSPSVTFVFCADNDISTKDNPGITHAHKAMEKIRVKEGQDRKTQQVSAREMKLTYPVFTRGNGTDWNDYFNIFGAEETKQKLEKFEINYLMSFPVMQGKKIVSCIENFEAMLEELGVTIRYNQLTYDVEIHHPERNYTNVNSFETYLKSEANKFNFMCVTNVSDFIKEVADRHSYYPQREWINSKPWDGVPRLELKVKNLMEAVDREKDVILSNGKSLFETLIRKWYIQAVYAAFTDEGLATEGVLIFQGKQAKGKTRYVKSLAPEHLSKEDVHFGTYTRDEVRMATTSWIVELGEFDGTMKKSDMERLKSYITRSTDEYRDMYERSANRHPRHAVYLGNTNSDNFLKDDTGNRRWWVIPLIDDEDTVINVEDGIDMQQLWAEAKTYLDNGEIFRLERDELKALNKSNEQFETEDYVTDRLVRLFEKPDAVLYEMTVAEVCLQVGIEKPSAGDMGKAGKIIRRLNGNRHKRSNSARLVAAPITAYFDKSKFKKWVDK